VSTPLFPPIGQSSNTEEFTPEGPANGDVDILFAPPESAGVRGNSPTVRRRVFRPPNAPRTQTSPGPASDPSGPA
jgi:hypothetical protein